MRVAVTIAGVVLLLVAACDRQAAVVSPGQGTAAAAGAGSSQANVIGQAAPGPGSAPSPPTKPRRGQVFRVPASKGFNDPRAMLDAMNGGELPAGVQVVTEQSEAKAAAVEQAKQRATQTVSDMYGMVAGKPIDIIEVTEVSGLWRVSFAARASKEAPSTVHVSMDGKLAFEGGYELQRRYEKLQIEHNFAQCLAVRGVRIIGDGRDKATMAQLKEVGSFAPKVFVDCGRAKDGCAPLMKKLGFKKLPTIEQGDDRFTGPRPRQFLETLSGCK